MDRRRRGRSTRSLDRRGGARALFGTVLLNKYIDGTPHIAALIDLSPNGMLVQKLLEPEIDRAFYAIELGIPWRLTGTNDERLWIWTQRVRDLGNRQALRFVGLSASDRDQIEEIVREARRPA